MVLLHYKKSDHNQFLYEKPGATIVAEVVAQLVEINNLRIQLDLLACAVEDLATHGPLKPEEIRGLTDQELVDNALIIAPPEKKKWAHSRQPMGEERFNEDKTHYRIGIIRNQHITEMMINTTNDAKKLISYKNVDEKKLLQLKMLIQMRDMLKAAVTIAYPNFEGLGDWQPAKMMSDGSFDYTDVSTNQIDYLDPKDSTLWWAGKEFYPEKLLNSYIGKNEKTKIIVKLTKKGSGAPMRQPGVNQQTKIQLMSMYHKKEEELKKLETNNQEDYKNSQWANPGNLKSNLIGAGDIKWKGSR